MEILTVDGIFRDGKVELLERPIGLPESARVRVTFLPEETAEEREALRQRAFRMMEEGLPLGGPPYPKRDELHDRFER